MKLIFRIFLGSFLALFLALNIGITPAFADFGDFGPPPPESISYLIRNGSASISGTQNLQASGTSIDITPDSGTTSPITVDARSVISVLRDIAASNPALFSISHTGFFDFGTPYAGGLYVKCATLSGAAVNPSCDDWQYTVNGSSPAVGVGLTTVVNTNSIQLYFGPSRRITPSSSSVTLGVSFTVLAESYIASSDSWTPAVGLTMRILQGDPFGSPTIISSGTTGADGRATFTINTAGSYTAGLAEDFYFPNSAITASATPSLSSPSVGSGGVAVRPVFDIPLALAYVTSKQSADGSFDSVLLSDWAAIAFAGGGAGDAREKLRHLFSSTAPVLSSVTDYERHAMALEALGINPYSAGGTDYIAHIIGAFDQTQIGDPAQINDDVFALIPLTHAGYGASDEIIQKVAKFILSKQSSNGSWEGSVDMTAAAIQALAPLHFLPNVSTALASAGSYLHGQQQNDGGFGASGKSNNSSTSWMLQAIYALGETPANWVKNNYFPQDYIATLQDRDGGLLASESSVSTRIWETVYAIPAIERKTWDSLLSSFSKPEIIPAVAPIPAPIETATATTTQTASSNAVLALLDVVVKNQKEAEVEKKAEPRPVVATSTEATSTPPRVSPQFVQTSAVATVDYGIPFQWWKWILLLLLGMVLAFGIAPQLLKMYHSRKPRRLFKKK